ncbi:thioredoxin-like protein [Gongronella butleri]|nr:thioredoxin-like protein [Gongronella butleri]
MDDALLQKLQQTHVDDDDDRRPEEASDVSDTDLDDQQLASEASGDWMGQRAHGPQTGPKGVLADEQHHRQWQAAKRAGDLAAYNARVLAKAPMTTTYLQDQQATLVLESREARKARAAAGKKEGEEDDDDLDALLAEEEEEDEAAMQAYRVKRLAELKQVKNHHIRQQHRVFGTLDLVDALGYVDAIDKEWRTVPVIVHVFDPQLPHCRQLDNILHGLARRYALAKFIRVDAADLDFDLVGSPAILAYKSGILVANLIRLDDDVGPVYSEDAIEDLLLRHHALGEDDLYDRPDPATSDEDDE